MISKLTAQEIDRALGQYGGDCGCARGQCMDFPSANTTITDFWSGFGQRSRLYPSPFPNAMRILLVSL
jgi:hypothetical protein